MGKRKRESMSNLLAASASYDKATLKSQSMLQTSNDSRSSVIQIITGSYDRVLHGVTATISGPSDGSSEEAPEVQFADTFLFNAHASAIRCLALSPLPKNITESPKLILASGSTDERINLYHVSASVSTVPDAKGRTVPSLGITQIQENPKNRELGSLLHHYSSITALYFPSRSKLLSAAEDNTIAISRTRDWTVLSTIKVPIPKAVGRPSGDTAPLGGTPAGVNDFAVHPSMKLMISVGKGEKCMRLWNLVTGKKAGVLTFEKEVLQGLGEGKWASGEGRKVEWNGNGDEFVVSFERGAVVFGMDSTPKCRILPLPSTKIHQIRYVLPNVQDGQATDLLAVSTEDGRVIFYSTKSTNALHSQKPSSKTSIPTCLALGQLGGEACGVVLRIKDFEVLTPNPQDQSQTGSFVVTGSSDGSVRVWALSRADFEKKPHDSNEVRAINDDDGSVENSIEPSTTQVGHMLGTFESGNRITCLKAFIMLKSLPNIHTAAEPEWADEFNGIDGSDEDSSSSTER